MPPPARQVVQALQEREQGPEFCVEEAEAVVEPGLALQMEPTAAMVDFPEAGEEGLEVPRQAQAAQAAQAGVVVAQ